MSGTVMPAPAGLFLPVCMVLPSKAFVETISLEALSVQAADAGLVAELLEKTCCAALHCLGERVVVVGLGAEAATGVIAASGCEDGVVLTRPCSAAEQLGTTFCESLRAGLSPLLPAVHRLSASAAVGDLDFASGSVTARSGIGCRATVSAWLGGLVAKPSRAPGFDRTLASDSVALALLAAPLGSRTLVALLVCEFAFSVAAASLMVCAKSRAPGAGAVFRRHLTPEIAAFALLVGKTPKMELGTMLNAHRT